MTYREIIEEMLYECETINMGMVNVDCVDEVTRKAYLNGYFYAEDYNGLEKHNGKYFYQYREPLSRKEADIVITDLNGTKIYLYKITK